MTRPDMPDFTVTDVMRLDGGGRTAAFASFNNPIYRASIDRFREQEDGPARSQFCAGCHDPVPFFSGKFDNPEYDVFTDPTASAGITCTVCHTHASGFDEP